MYTKKTIEDERRQLRLSASDKEPINPIGIPAPFAPIIWASHWSIYGYVDRIYLCNYVVYHITCMLGDNKDIMNGTEILKLEAILDFLMVFVLLYT